METVVRKPALQCFCGVWTISTMSFSYGFGMPQNKMVAVLWGLCTCREPLGKIVFHYDNVYKIEKKG